MHIKSRENSSTCESVSISSVEAFPLGFFFPRWFIPVDPRQTRRWHRKLLIEWWLRSVGEFPLSTDTRSFSRRWNSRVSEIVDRQGILHLVRSMNNPFVLSVSRALLSILLSTTTDDIHPYFTHTQTHTHTHKNTHIYIWRRIVERTTDSWHLSSDVQIDAAYRERYRMPHPLFRLFVSSTVVKRDKTRPSHSRVGTFNPRRAHQHFCPKEIKSTGSLSLSLSLSLSRSLSLSLFRCIFWCSHKSACSFCRVGGLYCWCYHSWWLLALLLIYLNTQHIA